MEEGFPPILLISKIWEEEEEEETKPKQSRKQQKKQGQKKAENQTLWGLNPKEPTEREIWSNDRGSPRIFIRGSPAREDQEAPKQRPRQEREPPSFMWPKEGPQKEPETRTKRESKAANINKYLLMKMKLGRD